MKYACVLAMHIHRRCNHAFQRERRPIRALHLRQELARARQRMLRLQHLRILALRFGYQFLQVVARPIGLRRFLNEENEKENQPKMAVRTPDAARLAAWVSSRVMSSTIILRFVKDAM